MKKILSILLILFLLVAPVKSHAQTEPASTESAKIEYFLPYPGMLPGSPLYPIKALRDRITEFFISDPSKRAEFYILQADKRLNAATLLMERGQGDLSESTVSKAEKYLEKALNEAEEMKKRGENNQIMLENIERSSEKHEEVLADLISKTEGELRTKISLSAKLNETVLNRVVKLRASE